MQRLRTTFKRSKTPTPADMKTQSSLEVPKQVRSASFDEIQLGVARETGAAVLLSVPQPGARSRSFDSAGSDDSGTYLEVPRLWPRRRSGKGTPPCVHCRHMEVWLAKQSEERTTPERIPLSSSAEEEEDDDDDESDVESPQVLLAPPPPARTFIPAALQSPPPSPGLPSFELQPPIDEIPSLPQRRRSISRQEAFFVEPTGNSLENVQASEDCANLAPKDSLVHDIYLAVPDLKRDRAASVDSCFTKVSGGPRTEEISGASDCLTVPTSGLRSRSVDIVLPTEEQSRYKALALTASQAPRSLNQQAPLTPPVVSPAYHVEPRLGKSSSGKLRPILVKFNTVELKHEVWFAKTSLKGTGITLYEFLTKRRHTLFMPARRGISKCWPQDGTITVLGQDGERHQVSTEAALDQIWCQITPTQGSTTNRPLVYPPTAAAPFVRNKPRKPVKK